jgi:hypothetical protein
MKHFRITAAIFAAAFISQMSSPAFAGLWTSGPPGLFPPPPPNPPVCLLPSNPDYVLHNRDLCIKEFKELKGIKVVNYGIRYITGNGGSMILACSAAMVLEGERITVNLLPNEDNEDKSVALFCPLLQEAAISKTALDVQVITTPPGASYLIGASVTGENP